MLEQLGDEYAELQADTPLLDSGLLDSILMQSLLAFVEDRYRTLVPAEWVRPERFGTLRQIAEVVQACCARDARAEGTDSYEVQNRLMAAYGLERVWLALSWGRQHLLRCAGRRPTWVLLSGLGAPASSWGLLMRSLNGVREAIAIDLAGFGVTPEPDDGDLTFPAHVRRTLAVLEQEVAEPVVLVGNSAGAMIAAEIARLRPELCHALVLISFGRVGDGARWWQTLQTLAEDPAAFWSRAFHDPPPLTDAIRRQLSETLASRAYREFLDPATVGRLDAFLQDVRAPTLFVGGLDDGIIPPAVVEAGTRQVPGSRLQWLPRCGHYAQSERSEELLVCINEFLRGLEGDGGAGRG